MAYSLPKKSREPSFLFIHHQLLSPLIIDDDKTPQCKTQLSLEIEMTLEKYKRLCIVTIPILIIAGVFLAFKIINNTPYFTYSCTINNCIPISETGLDDDYFKTRNKSLDNAILVNDDEQDQWSTYKIFYGINNLLSDVYLPDFKYGGTIVAIRRPVTNENIQEFSSLLDKKFNSVFFDLEIAQLTNDATIKELKCYAPLMLYKNGIAKVNCDINDSRAQIYIEPVSNVSIDKIIKFSDDFALDTKLRFLKITFIPTLFFFILSGLLYMTRRAVRWVSTGK
ncbi:hypothetical protein [Klebsiella quasipneumoniae]|uniref:hypothetical protein n=1 Tax=Klebsiella quasipneumoniae TaxID=1463165 RepID=UPI001E5FAFA2|nr:hypothetical protein [Klebsiella quasipneumoniae]MCD7074198.1 hypothetical protein [Klebsiella quasipneumoniae subsp. similipneumoniae]MCD7103149.1 hypothetical protein [Klebsiella quasipneumoniae subsp. similipneumoniae]